MKLNHIKAIIFDMDGLIFDTESIACRAINKALGDFDQTAPEGFYEKLIGQPLDNAARQLKLAFGSNIDPNQVLKLSEKYFMSDVAENGLPQKTGVIELLTLIEKLKIPKAVASSSPRHYVNHKLDVSKLDQYFSKSVCGDEITNGKPAPDIFLKAAEILGIEPKNCLVLEDSIAGVTGAKAAGMITIMVPDLIQPTPEIRAMVDKVVDSLHEVCDILTINSECQDLASSQ